MRKNFWLFFILITVCLFALVSCNEEAEPPHAHMFSETWIWDDVQHWHPSTCGHTDETSAAAEHDYSTTVIREATCTAEGIELLVCTTCNYTKTNNTAATCHQLKEYKSKDSTCTEAGWNTYEVCTRCDYTTYKEIPALEHDIELHAAQTATCSSVGWLEYKTCKRCDYTTYIEIPAMLHSTVQHNGKVPTCTSSGWTDYVICRDCPYTTYQDIPALGHDELSHKAQAATCTTIGWNAYVTCSRCDYTSYDEIAALGHNRIQHKPQTATCTMIGWDAYMTCSRCDYTTYEEIASLGHDEVPHDAKAPTCTVIGWNTYVTCSRCDYTTYEEITALGHDGIPHDAKAPTCTAIGWNAYVTCSRCDYTTYEEISALGHNEEHHDAQAATCTKTGWQAYKTCNRCDYTTYEENITPATFHSFENMSNGEIVGLQNPIGRVPATCFTSGYDVYYCTNSNCDIRYGTGERYEYGKTTMIDGHTYITVHANHFALSLMDKDKFSSHYEKINYTYNPLSKVFLLDFTNCAHDSDKKTGVPVGPEVVLGERNTVHCYIYSYREYTCDHCAYTYNRHLTDDYGLTGYHVVSAPQYKAPTCEEAGYNGRAICERCQIVIIEGETLQRIPHDTVITFPTCTSYGFETCTICGVTWGWKDMDGYVIHPEYKKLPHTPVEGTEIIHPATGTAPAYKTYQCEKCYDGTEESLVTEILD